jgi:hypothetical protein
MRDLQRCCSNCDSKQLCAHELEDKPKVARWPAYCPNQDTIAELATCLPLLSIPKELRRMKETDDAAAFETFAAVHRGAVWDAVLAVKREARGAPHWQPTDWMEGMAFQSEVGRILRQRFERSGNA